MSIDIDFDICEQVTNTLNDSNFVEWFNGSKVVDLNNKPMLLFHSYYDDNGHYDSGLVFYSNDLGYSSEFGNTTDVVFVRLEKPFITKDGYLRKGDNSLITLKEEPEELANTGFIDAISFADLDYLKTNYDGVISEDGFMVVSFLENNVYKVCELHRQ